MEISLEQLITKVRLEAHPVGSLFITRDSRNPTAILGGGTWQKIENRMIFGASSSHPVGETGGEENHTLTVDETPAHTHTRGTMEISGEIGPFDDQAFSDSVNGCFFKVRDHAYDATSKTSGGGWDVRMEASRSWTGETSSVGEGLSHNNMPPYVCYFIWERLS